MELGSAQDSPGHARLFLIFQSSLEAFRKRGVSGSGVSN